MKKFSQLGRSMIEMLGVLAIIGVLSIGALAGYSYAMQKYRVNEIIDTMYKLATVAIVAEPVLESSLARAPAEIWVRYADLSDLGLDGKKVAGMISTMEAYYYDDTPDIINIFVIKDEVPVEIFKAIKAETNARVFMTSEYYRTELPISH